MTTTEAAYQICPRLDANLVPSCNWEPRYDTRGPTGEVIERFLENSEDWSSDDIQKLGTTTYLGEVCTVCGRITPRPGAERVL